VEGGEEGKEGESGDRHVILWQRLTICDTIWYGVTWTVTGTLCNDSALQDLSLLQRSKDGECDAGWKEEEYQTDRWVSGATNLFAFFFCFSFFFSFSCSLSFLFPSSSSFSSFPFRSIIRASFLGEGSHHMVPSVQQDVITLYDDLSASTVLNVHHSDLSKPYVLNVQDNH